MVIREIFVFLLSSAAMSFRFFSGSRFSALISVCVSVCVCSPHLSCVVWCQNEKLCYKYSGSLQMTTRIIPFKSISFLSLFFRLVHGVVIAVEPLFLLLVVALVVVVVLWWCAGDYAFSAIWQSIDRVPARAKMCRTNVLWIIAFEDVQYSNGGFFITGF